MTDPGWMSASGRTPSRTAGRAAVRSSVRAVPRAVAVALVLPGLRPESRRSGGCRRGWTLTTGIFIALVAGACDNGGGGTASSAGAAAGAFAVPAEGSALLRSAPFVAAFLLSDGAEYRRITVAEGPGDEPYRSVLMTGAALAERVSGRRVTSRSNPISAADLGALRALLRRQKTFRPVTPPASWRGWEVGVATAEASVFLLMRDQGAGRVLLLGAPDAALELDLDASSADLWSRWWRTVGG